MKARGILFSAPMVRALLAGKKHQTRRLVKPPKPGLALVIAQSGAFWVPEGQAGDHEANCERTPAACPYGKPGDRLYVKEAAWMWCERRPNGTTPTGRPKWLYVPMPEAPVHYCADHPDKPGVLVVSPNTGNAWGWRKKLGRFLPRWASRITLEVTEVRVERLQDISEEEAMAEGVEPVAMKAPGDYPEWMQPVKPGQPHRIAFGQLWDSINGEKAPWSSNPWVWCISFRRIGACP